MHDKTTQYWFQCPSSDSLSYPVSNPVHQQLGTARLSNFHNQISRVSWCTRISKCVLLYFSLSGSRLGLAHLLAFSVGPVYCQIHLLLILEKIQQQQRSLCIYLIGPAPIISSLVSSPILWAPQSCGLQSNKGLQQLQHAMRNTWDWEQRRGTRFG